MKIGVFWVVIFMSQATHLLAQDNPYYRLKSGTDLAKSLPAKERYQYPAFLPGKLYFKNGSFSQGVFNYSRLLGEMHFIDGRGDTLALTKDPAIQFVSLGQDTFYFDFPKTFWRIIIEFPTVKLVSKELLVVIDTEKQGGYEQSTGTSAIRNTSYVNNGNGSLARLNVQSDILLAKKEAFSILDQNNRFYVPKQSVFLNLFPEKKLEIKKYIQENSINFNVLPDLQKLLSFCSEMP
ncbi:hypothetical protein [Spirosoma aerophilum]